MPGRSPAAIFRVASSIQPKSGVPSASTNSGTTTTTASLSATAAVVSVVARRAPSRTVIASFSARCASPGNGSTPALTRSTVAWLTSAPMTWWPLEANCTASGRPILPSATTVIFTGCCLDDDGRGSTQGTGRRLPPMSPAPLHSPGPEARSERLPRVESLTGLRWFAAFFVFLHHSKNFAPIPEVLPWGFLGVTGVTFFFVLSGFVLTWSWFPRDTAGRFYWRRFARIYPAYLVALVVALPVFYGTADVFQDPWDAEAIVAVVLSILLLQAWVVTPGIFFGGNPAGWSLSCEAFFYAVFPLAIHSVMRRRIRVLLGLALLTVVLMWAVLLWVRIATMPAGLEGFLLKAPPYRALEFFLGVLLAAAVRRGWRSPVGFWPAVALLLVSFVVLWKWQYVPRLDRWAGPDIVMNQITAPLYALVIVAAAQRDIGGRASFLRWPVLVALGQWSYAFYLTHATVIYAFRLVFGVQRDRLLGALALNAVVLAVALLAAWALYRVVEHPLEARMRAMLPPIPPQGPSPPPEGGEPEDLSAAEAERRDELAQEALHGHRPSGGAAGIARSGGPGASAAGDPADPAPDLRGD